MNGRRRRARGSSISVAIGGSPRLRRGAWPFSMVRRRRPTRSSSLLWAVRRTERAHWRAVRAGLLVAGVGGAGSLYAWDDDAVSTLLAALNDESWRVREMATKVVARRQLDDALELVADLQSDVNARVRAAASRALIALVRSDGLTENR